MEWRNIYRGMIMGISDLAPGISGGTIAVLLGIYDRLIDAVRGVLTKEWKKHLQFLIPLGVGIGAAIFSFSHLMNWLLEHYHRPTFYFFIGLVVGILPFLLRQSRAVQTFRWQHYILLFMGATIVFFLPVESSGGTLITDRSLGTYIYLFFSGFLGSAVMILPGISGSFVLVVLGAYETIIRAISELEFLIIITVGIGIAFGILTMSNIVHKLLLHYRTVTFAFIIGLVMGSVTVIFRQAGWVTSVREVVLCTILFLAGATLAHLLGNVEYRK